MSAMEEINKKISEGYTLLIVLQGSCKPGEAVYESLPSDVVMRVAVGLELWKAIAKQLGVSLAHTAALISPTGKVLASAQTEDQVQNACERWEYSLAEAYAETHDQPPAKVDAARSELTQGTPTRIDADSWVKKQILERRDGEEPTRVSRPEETTRPKQSSGANQPASTASTSDESQPARRMNTKVAIKFNNGRPRQVIDVSDTSTFTLGQLLNQIREEVTTLAIEYPRRKLDLQNEAGKTLQELGVDSHSSLVASVAGPVQNQVVAPNNTFATIIAYLLAMLAWIVESFKTLVRPAPRVATVTRVQDNPRLRGVEKKDRKPNQYWNGDSTVFEGPPDDDDERDKKD